MKTSRVVKRVGWVVACCLAATLGLSACKSTEEHPGASGQPSKSEHPTKEHPTQEHPSTNAPAK